MGFRFYKREKLFGGLGLNISKSGISWSIRGKSGSFGPKRTSVRTGVPGLTYVFDKGGSRGNNENGFSISEFIIGGFIWGILTLIISSIVYVFFPTYVPLLKIVLYVFWGLFFLKAVIAILAIFIPAFTLLYRAIKYILSLFHKKQSLPNVEKSPEPISVESKSSVVKLVWDEGHGKFTEFDGDSSKKKITRNRNSGEQPISSSDMKWDFVNEKYVQISVDQEATSADNKKSDIENENHDTFTIERENEKQGKSEIIHNKNLPIKLLEQDIEGALFDICSEIEMLIENTVSEFQDIQIPQIDQITSEQIKVAVRFDLSKILRFLEINPNANSTERNIIIASYAFFLQPKIDFNAVVDQGENLDYIIAEIKQLMNSVHPIKAGEVFLGKYYFKSEVSNYLRRLKEIATLVTTVDFKLTKKEKKLLSLID